MTNFLTALAMRILSAIWEKILAWFWGVQKEKADKEEVHKKVEEARDELKIPIDETKYPEEQQKQAEKAADDFFDKFRH